MKKNDPTRAQIELLCRLKRDTFQHCAPYYAPAKALVAKGYAQWQNDDSNTWQLKATAAGAEYVHGLAKP